MMPHHARTRYFARCCAPVLALAMALAACASPERTNADIDSGRFSTKLARLYLDGREVPQDDSKAAYLLSNASLAGDIEAKELLGRLYAQGRGVARDDELATVLFRAAVDGGNNAALNDLGQMIEMGRGTPADPATALDYYERGMTAGDPDARQNYQRLREKLEAQPSGPAPPEQGSAETKAAVILPE